MVGMTVIIPNRVPLGVPAGGEFAKRKRAEDDIALGANYPNPLTPTKDQVTRAAAEVARRRATGQVMLPNHVDYIAGRLAEQEAAYAAHKEGRAHPYDVYFAAIWDGAGGGYSKIMVEEELRYVRSISTQLQIGIVTPQSLLGTDDATDEQAMRWVVEREGLYAEALKCGGKNLSINQSSVISAQRQTEPVPPF